jgi:parvulin-like peptidyl-prolyl isomerase
MKRSWFATLTLGIGALSLSAWTAWPQQTEKRVIERIIAKINGEIITTSEIDRSVAELRAELARQNITGERLEQFLTEGQKNILRDLIDNNLLIQKGKELSINVEAQVIRYLDDMRRQRNIATMEEFEKWVTENTGTSFEDVKERIRNQFLTQRVVGQEVSSRLSVPREEIVKYYEEHKNEFVREEQVHLREILVSTEGKEPGEIPALEKKAQDIAARLKKGERFADLATKMSDNPDSAKNGGDIGFFKRGLLSKDIEDIVFNARRGSNTEVIKRPNGFLILRVEERYQPGQASLEEVEQEIMERLFEPKLVPALREYLTRLRQTAFIEIQPGYIDSGAAPGQDTAWKDPEQFKAAVTTKAEATRKKRKLLWLIPMGTKEAEPSDTQSSRPPAAPVPSEPSERP